MATENNGDQDAIWVSIGLTKNLGNYESLKLDAGKKQTLKDDDDPKKVWAEMWAEVEAQLEDRLSK